MLLEPDHLEGRLRATLAADGVGQLVADADTGGGNGGGLHQHHHRLARVLRLYLAARGDLPGGDLGGWFLARDAGEGEADVVAG